MAIIQPTSPGPTTTYYSGNGGSLLGTVVAYDQSACSGNRITINTDMTVVKVTVNLWKIAVNTLTIGVGIWTYTNPMVLVATSTNTVAGNSIPETTTPYDFNFAGAALTNGTTYVISPYDTSWDGTQYALIEDSYWGVAQDWGSSDITHDGWLQTPQSGGVPVYPGSLWATYIIDMDIHTSTEVNGVFLTGEGSVVASPIFTFVRTATISASGGVDAIGENLTTELTATVSSTATVVASRTHLEPFPGIASMSASAEVTTYVRLVGVVLAGTGQQLTEVDSDAPSNMYLATDQGRIYMGSSVTTTSVTTEIYGLAIGVTNTYNNYDQYDYRAEVWTVGAGLSLGNRVAGGSVPGTRLARGRTWSDPTAYIPFDQPWTPNPSTQYFFTITPGALVNTNDAILLDYHAGPVGFTDETYFTFDWQGRWSFDKVNGSSWILFPLYITPMVRGPITIAGEATVSAIHHRPASAAIEALGNAVAKVTARFPSFYLGTATLDISGPAKTSGYSAGIDASADVATNVRGIYGYGTFAYFTGTATLALTGVLTKGGIANFTGTADLNADNHHFHYSFMQQHYAGEAYLTAEGRVIRPGNFTVAAEGYLTASWQSYVLSSIGFSGNATMAADGARLRRGFFLLGRRGRRGQGRGIWR